MCACGNGCGQRGGMKACRVCAKVATSGRALGLTNLQILSHLQRLGYGVRGLPRVPQAAAAHRGIHRQAVRYVCPCFLLSNKDLFVARSALAESPAVGARVAHMPFPLSRTAHQTQSSALEPKMSLCRRSSSIPRACSPDTRMSPLALISL